VPSVSPVDDDLSRFITIDLDATTYYDVLLKRIKFRTFGCASLRLLMIYHV
jgi:hypothetical protein